MDHDQDADLVARASAYARAAHFGDTRKGSGVSYFAGHLEPVARIVRRDGGSDVQVAAAYLHDVAEDHGGQRRLDDVHDLFGVDVARIVADLSDSLVDTDAGEVKAPWAERKQAYLDSISGKDHRSLEVAAADKLHNASSMLDDLREIGDELWSRFTTGDPADQRWYYVELAAVLRSRLGDHPTAVALSAVVDELAAAIDAGPITGPIDGG